LEGPATRRARLDKGPSGNRSVLPAALIVAVLVHAPIPRFGIHRSDILPILDRPFRWRD